MKESEQKYRNLFDNLSSAAYLVDTNGFIVEVNKANELLTGYPREDIIGRHFTDLPFQEEGSMERLKRMKNRLETGEMIFPEEVKIIKKKGDKIWTKVERSMFTMNNKPFIQVLASLHHNDYRNAVDELKEYERKYREAYDLSKFYEDLFAHDMNNILQNIQSMVNFRECFKDDKEKMKSIGNIDSIISQHVKHGSNLISKVQKLSSVGNRSLFPVKVLPVLETSINNIKTGHAGKKIYISINFNGNENITIRGNELLVDLFDNIIENAVKHNHGEHVEIDIELSKIHDFVKMEFKDHGDGIPDDKKDKIFKIDKDRMISRIKDGGMGLGLSLVLKIVEKYDGKAWVEDRCRGEHEKGANFIVMIPC
jgi:PAS domain S-box-containing protein